MLFPRSSRRRTRISALPLLFLTVLGLLIGGLGAPAYAANTIKGSVTSGTTALPGITVQLGSVTNGVFTQAAGKQTTTATDGTYSFTALTTGDKYVVRFSNAEYTTVTSAEQTVSATADNTVNQAMTRRPDVSGRILNPDGAGLSGYTVEYGTLLDGAFTVVGAASSGTSSTGDYTIENVDAGTYTLRVSKATPNPFATAFYTTDGGNGATTTASAGTFTISTGADVTGRTVKLVTYKPVKLSGTVSRAAGVAVTVDLGTVSSGTFSPLNPAVATLAADNGAWEIQDQAAGSYVIRYRANGYETSYFAGKSQNATTSASGAVPVQLQGVDQTGLDSNLVTRVPASVSGFVFNQNGGGLPGVAVELGTKSNNVFVPLSPVKKATTGPDGGFTIADVPAGSYHMRYQHPAYVDTYYVSDGANAATDMPASAPLTTTGAPVSGKNAKLVDAQLKGGSVSGNTRNSAGAPAGDVTVELVTGSGDSLTPVRKAISGADGTFVIADVPAGSYKLKVTGTRYTAPSSGFYYAGADQQVVGAAAQGSSIAVTDNAAVTGVNPKLPAATVSGVVTSGGQPIQGVSVSIETRTLKSDFSYSYQTVAPAVTTGNDGSFSFRVPVSDYVIGYTAGGQAPVYWDGAGQTTGAKDEADLLEPNGHLTTTATPADNKADAALTQTTTVSGRVVGLDGAPLEGTKVAPVTWSGSAWAYAPTVASEALTDADGRYTLAINGAGITTDGTQRPFRLRFTPSDSGRETRYFPNASVPDEGQNVVVRAGQQLTGRDATLPKLASLTGTLKEVNGATSTQGVKVTAYREVRYTEQRELGGQPHTTWQAIGAPATVSNGSFVLRLPAGAYRLKAELVKDEVGFLPGLVGLDQAPSVTLGAEQVLTGQNYELPPVQKIEGKVADAASTPVAGAVVGARYTYVDNILDGVAQPSAPVGPKDGARQALTQADGTYAMQLRARDYLVFAKRDPSSATEPPTYHGFPSTQDPAQAKTVAVRDADVSGIDISLTGIKFLGTEPPWIEGLNDPGVTLVARPGTWLPADVRYSFQWQSRTSDTDPWVNVASDRDDAAYDGDSYTTPDELALCPLPILGTIVECEQYRVVVTPLRTTPTGVETGPSVASLPTAFTNGPSPSAEPRRIPLISGKAEVGSTLTADSGKWAAMSASGYEYQWYADDAPIPGATAATYAVKDAQLGRALKVRVNPKSSSSAPTPPAIFSEATVPAVLGSLRNTKAPSISGEARVDRTLTADPGEWNRPNLNYAYTWFSNGQVIPGATGKTYVPTEADVAKRLLVRVTATADGASPGAAQSAETAPVSLDGTDPTILQNTGAPTISGTPKAGSTLTATDGTWTNKPTSFTYQWMANTDAITGATSKTYVLTADEVGKKISVVVTARKSGYEPVSKESAQTAAVAKGSLTNTTAPALSGKPAPGETLTVSNGTWSPRNPTEFSYQWLVAGNPVSGETAASYLVREADLDKLVSVRVVAKAPGYDDATVTSNLLRVSEDGNTELEITRAAVLSGAARVGEQLTVTPGATDPTAERVAIQWLRDGTAIVGAIGARYTLTDADLGKRVSAHVTYTVDGYQDASEETARTAAVTEAEEPVDPVKPTLKTSKKIKGKKLVVKVRVFADSQDPVTGQVKLKEGKAFTVLKTLNNGKKKLVVKGLKKGYHSVKLTFLGNDLVKKKSKTLNFTIR